MRNIDLMREIASLAGYTIDATTGDDPKNKIRAQRRLNSVKSDIISRYAGRWPSNYREGWLPLGAIYNTGTVTFTQNSNTVTGSGTVWTTSMKGQKILGNDHAYYKIASVVSATSLILSEPYQGVTISGQTYQIWQDEYRLYPDVLSVGGFIDYFLPQRASETWPSNMKDSYPFPSSIEEPTVYTVLRREPLTDVVSTGTVTGVSGSTKWTGTGTTWLTGSQPIEPGFQFTVGTNVYHVYRVNSDTELETYQQCVTSVTLTTYTAKGKNAVIVRFKKPTDQRVVHYWYYAKDYPFVNDDDEDWVAESYSEVILNGAVRKDYLDKNDVARASLSKQEYEDSIKNMKVASEEAYTGIRTLGIFIPPEARD